MKTLVSGQATKFLTAVLGAGVESLSTSHFDWRTLTAGIVTALAVYVFPNSSSQSGKGSAGLPGA